MTGTVDKNKFLAITGEVIRLFEGGYYHPDMFLDGRINSKWYSIYANSGETMFGLDRYAGHGLYYSTKRIGTSVRDDLQYIYGGYYKYKSQEAELFWSYMDNVNARKNWKLGYKGGDQQDKLTRLAASIIYPEFINLINRYFDDKAKSIVLSSPELTFNFAYAVWNGSKFFQVYSDDVNRAVNMGELDPIKLNDIVINRRISGPTYKLPQSGFKMKAYFNSPEWAKMKEATGTIKPTTGLGLILGGLGVFWLFKKVKGKKP